MKGENEYIESHHPENYNAIRVLRLLSPFQCLSVLSAEEHF